MRSIELTIVFTLIFSANVINCYSQDSEPCRAKLLYLSKSYEGDCKKGLAHGEGIATGEDYYKGEFKKGLPHGKGRYVWFDGSIYDGDWIHGQKDGIGELRLPRKDLPDSVVVGYWRNDEYIGIYENRYELISKTPDVLSIGFIEKGGMNQLSLIFTLRKHPITVQGLSVTNLYGSGMEMNRGVIYRNIKYPWQGSIRFTYLDETSSGAELKYVELVVKINTPGSWEIRIDLRDKS